MKRADKLREGMKFFFTPPGGTTGSVRVQGEGSVVIHSINDRRKPAHACVCVIDEGLVSDYTGIRTCKRTHASCVQGIRLVFFFFSFLCSHLNLLLLKMKCFHSLGRFEHTARRGSLSVCGVMRQNCDEPLGNWVFFVVVREVEECQESPQRMRGLSGQTLSLFFPSLSRCTVPVFVSHNHRDGRARRAHDALLACTSTDTQQEMHVCLIFLQDL